MYISAITIFLKKEIFWYFCCKKRFSKKGNFCHQKLSQKEYMAIKIFPKKEILWHLAIKTFPKKENFWHLPSNYSQKGIFPTLASQISSKKDIFWHFFYRKKLSQNGNFAIKNFPKKEIFPSKTFPKRKYPHQNIS